MEGYMGSRVFVHWWNSISQSMIINPNPRYMKVDDNLVELVGMFIPLRSDPRKRYCLGCLKIPKSNLAIKHAMFHQPSCLKWRLRLIDRLHGSLQLWRCIIWQELPKADVEKNGPNWFFNGFLVSPFVERLNLLQVGKSPCQWESIVWYLFLFQPWKNLELSFLSR